MLGGLGFSEPSGGAHQSPEMSEVPERVEGYSIQPEGSIIPWYEEPTDQRVPGRESVNKRTDC